MVGLKPGSAGFRGSLESLSRLILWHETVELEPLPVGYPKRGVGSPGVAAVSIRSARGDGDFSPLIPHLPRLQHDEVSPLCCFEGSLDPEPWKGPREQATSFIQCQ